MIRAIIFDLDGTLLDTLQDLVDSANAALTQMGHPTHTTAEYRRFIGRGIRELAVSILPDGVTTEDEISRCLTEFREQYGERWDATTCPYPGVATMLDALTLRGMPLAILSNKPHDFTVLSVDRLLGRWDFREVRGVSEQTLPKPDPTGALAVAASLGVRPCDLLYVGDTSTDMDTASAAGMVSVGVTWGFRDEAELRAHEAHNIIHSPMELLRLI
jgi:phosphoglycolate phosphatase